MDAAGRQAVGVDQGSSESYAMLSRFLKDAGRPAEALRAINQAIQLTPNKPPPYFWFLGDIFRLLGRQQEAYGEFQQLRVVAPDAWQALMFLAVLDEDSGRHDDARTRVDELLKIFPEFSLQRFQSFASYSDPSITEHMVAALREAGLPE